MDRDDWREARRDANRAGRLTVLWVVIAFFVIGGLVVVATAAKLQFLPWVEDQKSDIRRNTNAYEQTQRQAVSQAMTAVAELETEIAELETSGGEQRVIDGKYSQRCALMKDMRRRVGEVDRDDIPSDTLSFIDSRDNDERCPAPA